MRTYVEINVQTGERSERPYTPEEEAAADAMVVENAPIPDLTPDEKLNSLLDAFGLTKDALRDLLK